MDTIDLSGSWSSFWDAVTNAAGPQLTNLMSVIGIGILVITLIAYFWQRARSKGGDAGKLGWAAAFGALLSAPGVLLPLLLTIVDLVGNALIGIFNSTAG